MTSKTVAMWIVMDVSGHYEVATDEAVARRRWLGRFGGPFVEKKCRVVKLNLTMSESLELDSSENKSDLPVNIVVPDEAGRIAVVGKELR